MRFRGQFSRSRKSHDVYAISNNVNGSNFLSTNVFDASDLEFKNQRKNLLSISSVEKLHDEFNKCIKNWTFYMLKQIRSYKKKSDKELRNLQIIFNNIESFQFDKNKNKLSGRLTVVVNISQDNQEYKFLTLLSGGVEQILIEGLRKGWILEGSDWVGLLNIL